VVRGTCRARVEPAEAQTVLSRYHAI
jgi:hypothetical protein